MRFVINEQNSFFDEAIFKSYISSIKYSNDTAQYPVSLSMNPHIRAKYYFTEMFSQNYQIFRKSRVHMFNGIIKTKINPNTSRTKDLYDGVMIRHIQSYEVNMNMKRKKK